MSTADACAREAAWLNTTGDGLAELPATAGGPWGVVQAYWPGARQATQQTGIYVCRATIADLRAANQRIRPGYAFRLKLIWPVRSSGTTPLAETEQQNLDNAVELLLERIRGPLGDKSHGGRFQSAGESPGRQPQVTVTYEDPEDTLPSVKALKAAVTYQLDDYEISG